MESRHHTQLDFVMTLWCIWKRRNDKLWNDIETPRVHLNVYGTRCLTSMAASLRKSRKERA
jgi:hypothetical protein